MGEGDFQLPTLAQIESWERTKPLPEEKAFYTYPNVYRMEDLLRELGGVNGKTEVEINGNWLPSRSMGFNSLRQRFRAAWLVFTGRADALRWPGGQ